MVSNTSGSNSDRRASMSDSEIFPLSTAASSSRTLSPPGAGISSVEPFFTPSAWSLLPPQSVMTAPSKPHSPRKISMSRCLFSLAYVPFTRL